jgi:hypothetical protein
LNVGQRSLDLKIKIRRKLLKKNCFTMVGVESYTE